MVWISIDLKWEGFEYLSMQMMSVAKKTAFKSQCTTEGRRHTLFHFQSQKLSQPEALQHLRYYGSHKMTIS